MISDIFQVFTAVGIGTFTHEINLSVNLTVANAMHASMMCIGMFLHPLPTGKGVEKKSKVGWGATEKNKTEK